MEYLELIEKINDRKLDWLPVHEMVNELLNNLCEHHPEKYNEFIQKLEDYTFKISKEEAVDIVQNMKPRGEVWTFDEIRNFVNDEGITSNICDWYLTMNMAVNDYYDTAAKFGLQNEDEFYFSLAKDFINDLDAKKHKTEKYFIA